MVGCSRICLQQQETCSNREDAIQTEFWKTPLERGPHGTNGVAMSRGIWKEATGKLETCGTSNGRSPEKHETAVRQEEKEPSRLESWRPRMAGEQKYPVKSTLKEARQ